MLTEFFQSIPLPTNRLFGIYDPRLVVLSYMVSVFASYIALDLTRRLRDRTNTKISSLLWLLGGSIAMGSGIWAMHFIGMLSFTIPSLTLEYDLFWTGISLLVAILASGFALFLLKASLINTIHLVGGGVILGLAIASMHYTGMEGMLITLNIRYLPGLFFISILIAIIASEAAIWLALKSNKVIARLHTRIKFISAIIMGLAICGMHYTGMAASVFTPLCGPSVLAGKGGVLDPTILAMAIAAITFVILGIAFFASSYKEAMNQQQFEEARQLGMAEISSSVLHNVGNVLNSVNVSANMVSEKLASSQLSNLEKLSTLLNEHKHDLTAFLTTDPKGSKIVDFVNHLNDYREKEQIFLVNEINVLLKNIVLIKDIIGSQQALTKSVGLESLISINELMDEALLITGLHFNKEIKIEKNYGKFSAVITDKVKLLQVLTNLLRNTKDALMESSHQDKLLIIRTAVVNKDKVIIELIDNGIGIEAKKFKQNFLLWLYYKKIGTWIWFAHQRSCH